MRKITSKPTDSPSFLEFEGSRFFMFSRNVSGVRKGLTPVTSNTFRVDVEPWGVYMLERDFKRPWFSSPSTHYGAVQFENPFFIEHDRWKDVLSQKFGGAKGRALSDALLDAGFDLVVTHDKYGLSEVCALDESKISRFSPYQAYERIESESGEIELMAVEKIPSSTARSDLVYVDHGRCLPVSQEAWEVRGVGLLEAASKKGFDSVLVTSPPPVSDAGKDVLRSHKVLCLDESRIISCTRPLWYEKGYTDTPEELPMHTSAAPPLNATLDFSI